MAGQSASRRRRALSAAVVVFGLASIAAVTEAQDQTSEPPPFYALLPRNYPGPLIRVCSTPEGICAVPYTIPPGEPCSCVRPDSVWVSGVVTH
ncbi:MAG TPA: hypothetical protein VEH80_10475 [Candidatus Bathyarchaeia archaeon]|nr:hypothetical protein [Candidatus Bathyarchaeia archaeon]